jgi:hypothetical protein
MENRYTVVLARPEYATADYGSDVVVHLVLAPEPSSAVAIAQARALAYDMAGTDPVVPPEGEASYVDYVLLVVFAGHHEPLAMGQLDDLACADMRARGERGEQ